MTELTVPYLFRSVSRNVVEPGTLVMASYIESASDEEILCLGRRLMAGKYYWNDKKFLDSVRSAYFKYGYEWVIGVGDLVTFQKQEDFVRDFRMCAHSEKIGRWRLKKENEYIKQMMLMGK